MISRPSSPAPDTRLEGWKAIGDYLRRDQKTARRWYRDEGLPVYKETNSIRSRVYAYTSEIDAWRDRARASEDASAATPVNGELSQTLTHDSGTVSGSTVLPDGEVGELMERPDGSPSGRERRRTRLWVAVVLAVSSPLLMLALARWRTDPPATHLRLGRLLSRATSEGARPTQISLPVNIGAVVASRDGRYAFVFEYDRSEIYSISAASREIKQINAGVPIKALAISHDGNTLYCGAATRGIRTIKVSSGQTRDFHTEGGVSDVALSPDGRELYVALGPRGVWKLSVETGKSSAVTLHPAPLFLALDRTGQNLYVSYQNGGPGGRDGHDKLGAFDLRSGKSMISASAPPMVGGPPSVSPATGDIWVQMWDACVTKTYDHAGCPTVPSYGFQIFRANDLMLVKSMLWGERIENRAHFPTDGAKAIIPGPSIQVLDSARFRLLERWPMSSWSADSSADGRRVFVLGRSRLLILDPVPASCLDVAAPIAQEFAFDGSLEDAIEATAFHPAGTLQFIPGRVGQAVRLGHTISIRMRSPAHWRLGDDSAARVSIAMWFRARSTTSLLKRSSSTPWRLDWDAGKLRFGIESDLVLEANALPDQWHHVVVSRDDSQYRLFVNGRLMASGESKVAGIGEYSSEFISEGDHDLDELITFSESLSEIAISKLASMGANGHCNSQTAE